MVLYQLVKSHNNRIEEFVEICRKPFSVSSFSLGKLVHFKICERVLFVIALHSFEYFRVCGNAIVINFFPIGIPVSWWADLLENRCSFVLQHNSVKLQRNILEPVHLEIFSFGTQYETWLRSNFFADYAYSPIPIPDRFIFQPRASVRWTIFHPFII